VNWNTSVNTSRLHGTYVENECLRSQLGAKK
jgi:hypothetical protein